MKHFIILILTLFCLAELRAEYPPAIEGAQVEVYREVKKTELKVWIVGDVEKGAQKPAVVLFFGGGWRFGSPDSLQRHAHYLAQRGMICLLADYRVANRQGARIADCVEDAKAAIAWTRRNAVRLGIDPKRIAAGGASAGGHLAACSALVPGFGNEEKPDALLLFNPALVMSPFEGQDFGIKHRWSRRALGAKPEEVSPIHHLDMESPPTWIAHGSADNIVPIVTAKAYQKRMEELGVKCEFFEAQRMPHAFHYRDPWFTKVMVGLEAFLKRLQWLP